MRDGYAEVDGEGNLRIPADVARRMGLTPGARVKFRRLEDRLLLQRPITQLARVYIEPTTECNLRCRTCIRNVWQEPLGRMAGDTFRRILNGLEALPEPPTIFFGGFGEPLVHPEILEMVGQARHLGGPVEMITNGILLDEKRAEALIEVGLERLWVSIDGASPECYADVRQADSLSQVIANLERLQHLRVRTHSTTPAIGISFVAMKRNLDELAEVLKLEYHVGADKFLITNVYPHTVELGEQILYRRSIGEALRGSSTIRMPRLDWNRDTTGVLEATIRGFYGSQLEGLDLLWASDTCPFVSRGSTCVRWDGQVSPCLPLLHSHTSYLEGRRRDNTSHSFGSVREHRLLDLWASPEYVSLRARLEDFDFSPCTACNSCEYADSNQEDCFGNRTPTCGGCLWAQGFIQCP
ncbi:MAG TPA: radical SAM protein [Candidatus Sulfotelmatobacter sp.]|nr:radical SAM protein [Candidatus Sulfotelmatobacter sp.]